MNAMSVCENLPIVVSLSYHWEIDSATLVVSGVSWIAGISLSTKASCYSPLAVGCVVYAFTSQ